jgi:hypothetical protein
MITQAVYDSWVEMIFMDMIYGKVDIKAFTTPLLMGAN